MWAAWNLINNSSFIEMTLPLNKLQCFTCFWWIFDVEKKVRAKQDTNGCQWSLNRWANDHSIQSKDACFVNNNIHGQLLVNIHVKICVQCHRVGKSLVEKVINWRTVNKQKHSISLLKKKHKIHETSKRSYNKTQKMKWTLWLIVV